MVDPMARLVGVLRASASLHTQLSEHCSILPRAHLHEVTRLSTLVYRDIVENINLSESSFFFVPLYIYIYLYIYISVPLYI